MLDLRLRGADRCLTYRPASVCARCVVDEGLEGSLDGSAMLKRVCRGREVAMLRRDFRALCCRRENIVSVTEEFRGLVERTQRLGGSIDGVRGLGRLPEDVVTALAWQRSTWLCVGADFHMTRI